VIDTHIADQRRHQAELERERLNAYQREHRARHNARTTVDPNPLHITGPCQAAYARGCRCSDCRRAWTEGCRRRRKAPPSPLAIEADRLRAELDAAEMHIDALREENAALRCRLDELESDE
jgi:hypothetical protein